MSKPEMTDKRFLEKLASLLEEYEESFRNRKIIGCLLDIEDSWFEWDGAQMAVLKDNPL